MSSRPALSIQRALNQPGLHRESCPERQNPALRQPQGSQFAVWQAGRTAGQRAGRGGRRRGAGTEAPPEVPARPPARPARPRRRPRCGADRAPRCRQVSSPVGCSAAAARASAPAPRFSAAAASPRLRRLSVRPSVRPRPLSLPLLRLSSLSSSALSLPFLLPSSGPGRPCKVAPESPGSRVGRQPPAAAAGSLGCPLPGRNTRTTFVLFWGF